MNIGPHWWMQSSQTPKAFGLKDLEMSLDFVNKSHDKVSNDQFLVQVRKRFSEKGFH